MTLFTLSAALIAIPLFIVGFMVSIQRGKTDVMTGGDNDPTGMLNKTIRSHGNQAEWAGVLVAMILYLGTTDTAGWVGWVALTVAAGRIMHGVGFLVCKTLEKPHPLKVAGSLITYIGGIVLAITLITGSSAIMSGGLSDGLGRDLDSTLSATEIPADRTDAGNGDASNEPSSENRSKKSFVDALDDSDLAKLGQTLQVALETSPSGQKTPWRNGTTGHSGSVTPQPAYQDQAGVFCREFNITARIDNREESFWGTACRHNGGMWRRLS